jgi:TRAP-type C4-dicarboxylate transport system substrate-binding protein
MIDIKITERNIAGVLQDPPSRAAKQLKRWGKAGMKRLLLICWIAACAWPAWAQDKVVVDGNAPDRIVNMKVSLWLPPTHPLVPATKAWADDIEKQSGGTIRMTIFPSEQLGKAFDHYDMARDGIADVTYVSAGYQPGRFPIAADALLPFLIKDGRTGTLAVDEWYRKYARTEMKDTYVCFAFLHDPGTLHSKKKIVLPSDLNGMKIRPAGSTISDMVKMFGGTNVQTSAPEARDAIERGVADAITFPWGSLILFGIDKAVKYHIDAPLYTALFTYNINLDRYNALSPGQRQVIDDHCNQDWAARISSSWIDFETAGRVKLKADPGHEVYPLTAEQLGEWKKSLRPLHEAWAAAVRKSGGDPDAVDADLKAALKKYQAGL